MPIFTIDRGDGFPFASWLQQHQGGPADGDSWERWPYWKPLGYGITNAASQLAPARHGFLIPHDTPGVRFRITDYEWNHGGDRDSLEQSYGTDVPTPSLVALANAYYLYEKIGDNAVVPDLLTFDDVAGVLSPNPNLARALLAPQNPASYMRWLPPATPILYKPFTDTAISQYYGATGNYTWEGDPELYAPWAIKAPSEPGSNRRLSAQCASILGMPIRGAEGPRDGVGEAFRTWDGAAWTLEPVVEPTGDFTPVSLGASGIIWYAPTIDADTGVLTGATAVPLGVPLRLDSFVNASAVALTWPLSVRGLRAEVSSYIFPEGEGYGASWESTNCVIIWRPMGDFAIQSYPTTGTNPTSSYGSLGRRGCNTDALSYVYQVIDSGAPAAGWRILGVADPGVADLGAFGMDVSLIDPPDPGQDVWVFVGNRLADETNGQISSYVLPGSAFLVPGPTVLPHCLPVMGGGAIPGGTG